MQNSPIPDPNAQPGTLVRVRGSRRSGPRVIDYQGGILHVRGQWQLEGDRRMLRFRQVRVRIGQDWISVETRHRTRQQNPTLWLTCYRAGPECLRDVVPLPLTDGTRLLAGLLLLEGEHWRFDDRSQERGQVE